MPRVIPLFRLAVLCLLSPLLAQERTPLVHPEFRADPSLVGVPTALLPLADGGVIVALESGDLNRVVPSGISSQVVRLLPSGQRDPAFVPTSVPARVYCFAQQSDGRILVGGAGDYDWMERLLLVRLGANGGIDPTFVADGAIVENPEARVPRTGYIAQLVMRPDGRILVFSNEGRLFRVLTDGSQDRDFTAASFGFTQSTDVGNIALTSDGKIYHAIPGRGLARLLENGAIDPSFSSPLRITAADQFPASRRLRCYPLSGDRFFVTYSTWTGRGGTSIAWTDGSLIIDAQGRSSGVSALALSCAPTSEGVMLAAPTWGSPSSQPSGATTGAAYYASDGRTRLFPANLGVLPINNGTAWIRQRMFGPDGTLWVIGDFDQYNGVPTPRIARLNRVAVEVEGPPLLVSTWAEASEVRAGEPVQLHATASGPGPITYEWALNAGTYRTSAPTIRLTPAEVGGGRWRVTALNSAGTSASVSGEVNVTPGELKILEQPYEVAATEGRTVHFKLRFSPGIRVTSWEWRHNDTFLTRDGYWTGMLVLPKVTPAFAGRYTVTVFGASGERVTGAPIELRVGGVSRFANFSVRAMVGWGEREAIVGFSIPPGSTRHLWFRGRGPSLAAYGVTDPLVEPKLGLFDMDGRRLGPAAGALMSEPLSYSAYELPPGSYSVRLAGKAGGTGVGLAEVNESDEVSERLTNLSARVYVTASDPAIVGFSIKGTATKRILVRAAGPALRAFGVTDVLVDPRMELRDQAGALVAQNNDWQSQPEEARVAIASAAAGAFPFVADSRDSALIATLPPGNYTAVIPSANGAAGIVLAELYELP